MLHWFAVARTAAPPMTGHGTEEQGVDARPTAHLQHIFQFFLRQVDGPVGPADASREERARVAARHSVVNVGSQEEQGADMGQLEGAGAPGDLDGPAIARKRPCKGGCGASSCYNERTVSAQQAAQRRAGWCT
jgi:hypothetical protein